MTIHTTCFQAGAAAATPHGFAELGWTRGGETVPSPAGDPGAPLAEAPPAGRDPAGGEGAAPPRAGGGGWGGRRPRAGGPWGGRAGSRSRRPGAARAGRPRGWRA